MSINDRLEAKVLLLLLNDFDLADELLQLIDPIGDKSCLLLQVHALFGERPLMFKESVHFLKLGKEVVDAKVLVLSSPHEVLKHLGLAVQVLSLVSLKVRHVHVFDAQVALKLGHSCLKKFQVFCLQFEHDGLQILFHGAGVDLATQSIGIQWLGKGSLRATSEDW